MLLLLVRTLLPAPAPAMSGGILIDICGVAGPVLIQQDPATENASRPGEIPCADCGKCPFCTAVDTAPSVDARLIPRSDRLAEAMIPLAAWPTRPGLERLWPAGRGPPARSVNGNDSFMAETIERGSAPWS